MIYSLDARWNENANNTFLKTDGSLHRYIHIKTSALRFDFEMCSARIYSMTSLPFKVKSSCITILVFPSPTARPLEILIKTSYTI